MNGEQSETENSDENETAGEVHLKMALYHLRKARDSDDLNNIQTINTRTAITRTDEVLRVL
jgi:hypothetical protein